MKKFGQNAAQKKKRLILQTPAGMTVIDNNYAKVIVRLIALSAIQ